MWIKRFEVTGFLGNRDIVAANFNQDLNILTGRNGSGKTSLLKLMWYIMSGNIIHALREVEFSKAVLITSEYTCTVIRTGRVYCKVEIVCGDKVYSCEDIEDEDGETVVNAEDEAAEIVQDLGRSVFLPTFRRIEGGFSLGSGSPRAGGMVPRPTKKTDVEQSLEALSTKMSNSDHVFVSAISTGDIVLLLQRRFSNLSEEYNKIQQSMSQEIIETIRKYSTSNDDNREVETANKLLNNIRQRIETVERSRSEVMTPITAVSDVVQRLLRHKGIQLGRLNFGDATDAISSDLLSAGEKQMLSFIAYNGLNTDSVFFIDEPELSLHVDWQRQLFSIMTEQQSTNQFILATHSPFIYSKYPDKEISLSSDRGDAGA